MFPWFPLAFCLACEPLSVALAADEPVDVELVLAVDVSRSMDPEEFALQRAGYVSALRHPDFIAAVRSGMHGRIALTYFEWAGTVRADTMISWRLIEGAEGAEAFASLLEEGPDATFRGTSISAALSFAADLFDGSGFQGMRRVIDISGDGPNNVGPPVSLARDEAVGRGIVINGLPILIKPSPTFEGLDRYYAECVIGGPGSFLLPIRDASEFATAIRRKLILEVSGTQPQVIPAQLEPPVDCRSGERDRRLYLDPYFPQLGP